MEKTFRVDAAAQTVLCRHGWPGNVRELENVISSACITAAGDFIDWRICRTIAAPGDELAARRRLETLSLEECARCTFSAAGMCRATVEARNFWDRANQSVPLPETRRVDTRKEKTGGRRLA